jgi:hypothetical protein
MNGTFTSYAAVRMVLAGQVVRQQTIRRAKHLTFAMVGGGSVEDAGFYGSVADGCVGWIARLPVA